MTSVPPALKRLLSAVVALGAVTSVTVAAAGGPAGDPVNRVLGAARAQIGEPYGWGGSGPERWDCSGLVQRVWGYEGKVDDIPRVSWQQQRWAIPIPYGALRPGDLVFYGNPVDHVAIYIGDGKIIDAASSVGKVVERRMWKSETARFGRVPRAGMPKPPRWRPPPQPMTPTEAAVRRAAEIRQAAARAAAEARKRATAKPTARPTSPAPRPAAATPTATSTPASAVAARAVRLAASAIGQPYGQGGVGRAYDDTELVTVAWLRAGGSRLPRDRAQLARVGTPVPAWQARPGDLVVLGNPADPLHVGVYVGGRQMVDASRSLGKVVRRGVLPGSTFRRLPAPR